jgi:hypothetical protein
LCHLGRRIPFDCLVKMREVIKESRQATKPNDISMPSIKVLHHKGIHLAPSSIIPPDIIVNNKLIGHPWCNFNHLKQEGLLRVHTIIARSFTNKVTGVNTQSILTGIKQPLKMNIAVKILKMTDCLRIRQVINRQIFAAVIIRDCVSSSGGMSKRTWPMIYHALRRVSTVKNGPIMTVSMRALRPGIGIMAVLWTAGRTVSKTVYVTYNSADMVPLHVVHGERCHLQHQYTSSGCWLLFSS